MGRPEVVLRGVHRGYTYGPPWRRRHRSVLRDVHLTLRPGEVVTLMGENGAGKTTLLRLAAGLLSPDAGTVEVFGEAPHRSARARARLGFASGDERSLFPRLTGRHNLEFFAALQGVPRAVFAARLDELRQDFDLGELLDRPVDHCSAGMRVRLGLARALLHAPALLLLDEPTKSLDERHGEAVHAALRRRAAEGLMILATTHSSAEVHGLRARCLDLVDGQLIERSPEAKHAPEGSP